MQEIVKEDSEWSHQEWVFVGTKDADLSLLSSVKALFETVRPTHVLHLAAKVGGLYANSCDNVGFFRHNVMIQVPRSTIFWCHCFALVAALTGHMSQDNINILCKEFGVQKLVSCLSTCIFPNKVTYPIHEACLHDGAPHPSNEGYAFVKRMVDVQNRLYRTQYGCNFTIGEASKYLTSNGTLRGWLPISR